MKIDCAKVSKINDKLRGKYTRYLGVITTFVFFLPCKFIFIKIIPAHCGTNYKEKFSQND